MSQSPEFSPNLTERALLVTKAASCKWELCDWESKDESAQPFKSAQMSVNQTHLERRSD